ncbi:hypothetical protein AB1Y20_022589 [Prymnesium parvum]|uniref:Tyrosine-protein phosphatase n=1 Tax=Prymnesium parvum TaxID=97485 RepID=A0AB34JK21_PRYPA
MSLCPPINFALVAPGVYRSGFPTRHNLSFLRTLGLHTLLRLEDEEYPAELLEWIDAAGIRVDDCILTANKEPFVTTDPVELSAALSIMLDGSQHPVLIHSLRGQRRCGVLVACYRKLHRWSLAAAFEEYRRFAGTSSSLLDFQYIELFDPSMVESMFTTSSRESENADPPSADEWAGTPGSSFEKKARTPSHSFDKQRSALSNTQMEHDESIL